MESMIDILDFNLGRFCNQTNNKKYSPKNRRETINSFRNSFRTGLSKENGQKFENYLWEVIADISKQLGDIPIGLLDPGLITWWTTQSKYSTNTDETSQWHNLFAANKDVSFYQFTGKQLWGLAGKETIDITSAKAVKYLKELKDKEPKEYTTSGPTKVTGRLDLIYEQSDKDALNWELSGLRFQTVTETISNFFVGSFVNIPAVEGSMTKDEISQRIKDIEKILEGLEKNTTYTFVPEAQLKLDADIERNYNSLLSEFNELVDTQPFIDYLDSRNVTNVPKSELESIMQGWKLYKLAHPVDGKVKSPFEYNYLHNKVEPPSIVSSNITVTTKNIETYYLECYNEVISDKNRFIQQDVLLNLRENNKNPLAQCAYASLLCCNAVVGMLPYLADKLPNTFSQLCISNISIIDPQFNATSVNSTYSLAQNINKTMELSHLSGPLEHETVDIFNLLLYGALISIVLSLAFNFFKKPTLKKKPIDAVVAVVPVPDPSAATPAAIPSSSSPSTGTVDGGKKVSPKLKKNKEMSEFTREFYEGITGENEAYDAEEAWDYIKKFKRLKKPINKNAYNLVNKTEEPLNLKGFVASKYPSIKNDIPDNYTIVFDQSTYKEAMQYSVNNDADLEPLLKTLFLYQKFLDLFNAQYELFDGKIETSVQELATKIRNYTGYPYPKKGTDFEISYDLKIESV